MDNSTPFLKSIKGIAIICSVVGLLVGFFLGMEYKAYQIRSAFQKVTDVFGDAQPKAETKQEAEEKFIEKKMGDEIQLATIKYKINQVEEKQVISSKFGKPLSAKEDTKFVILNMSVTNITTSGFLFPDTVFLIVDDKERQFQVFRDTIGNIDNYLNVRSLSPSITEQGAIVYELPKDAASYTLVTGKAGTNEFYVVPLIPQKQIAPQAVPLKQEGKTKQPITAPTPPPPLKTIPGLTSIDIRGGYWENWDADAESDGPIVYISFLDSNGSAISPDIVNKIPLTADVNIVGGKSIIYPDKIVFIGSFTSEQIVPSLLGPKIRIPKEKLDFDLATDSPVGKVEVKIHTPEQGDFSAKDSISLREL